MSEEWVEVSIEVVDQANRSHTRHLEYKANDADPVKAADSLVDHLVKQVGTERVHDAQSDT